jgi:hypothetical protein
MNLLNLMQEISSPIELDLNSLKSLAPPLVTAVNRIDLSIYYNCNKDMIAENLNRNSFCERKLLEFYLNY